MIKVFCENCKYVRYGESTRDNTMQMAYCFVSLSDTEKLDPVFGKEAKIVTNPIDCRVKNKDYDCEDFEQKPPKVSWWQRLKWFLPMDIDK